MVEVPKSFKLFKNKELIPELFKTFENKDFPKQPIKEVLEVVKMLNKLIEPKEDPIEIKKEISKPIQIYIISAAAYSIYDHIKKIFSYILFPCEILKKL